MTEKQLQEHFPELSVMDFKVLCNIAFHGEIPSSYALRNIASRSRANVNDVNEALSRLKRTPYLDGEYSSMGRLLQKNAAVPL